MLIVARGCGWLDGVSAAGAAANAAPAAAGPVRDDAGGAGLETVCGCACGVDENEGVMNMGLMAVAEEPEERAARRPL